MRSLVTVGAYVEIDGCSVDYSVLGDVVEFAFDGHPSGFDLVATETGLSNLADASAAALLELRGLKAGRCREPE